MNPFQRSFIAEIRRVDDMARRVRFFATQIEREKDHIPVRPLYDSAPLLTVGPRAAQTMDELDVKLSEHEKRLIQMNDSYQLLSDRLRELIEAQHVLRETAVFFDRVSLFYVMDHHWGPQSTFPRPQLSKPRSERHSMTVPPPFCSTTTGRVTTPLVSNTT